MYGRGSVRSGNCLFGEMSVRGNVRRRSVRRESVSRGIVLGEVSFWELSSRGTVHIPFFLVRILPYLVRILDNMDHKKLRIWTLFTQCQSMQGN